MIDKLQNGEWEPVPKRNDLPKLPEKIQQRLTAIVESSQKRQLLSTPENEDEAKQNLQDEKTIDVVADHSVDEWDENGHAKAQKKRNRRKRAKAKSKNGANNGTIQDG